MILRQLLKLVVNVDNRAVLLSVIANHHGLLHGAEVGVLGQDPLLNCV
jgi:hypothetical protein